MIKKTSPTFDWKLRILTVLLFILGIPLAFILVLTILASIPLVGQLMAGLYMQIAPCVSNGGDAPTCIVLGHDIGGDLYNLAMMIFVGGMLNFLFAFKLLFTFFSPLFLLGWISIVALIWSLKWRIKRRLRRDG